jgi:hypothetical protein
LIHTKGRKADGTIAEGVEQEFGEAVATAGFWNPQLNHNEWSAIGGDDVQVVAGTKHRELEIYDRDVRGPAGSCRSFFHRNQTWFRGCA